MSDPPWDDEITTADEFERALEELLISAARNDIELSGSWVYRNGNANTDLEVMIYDLEPSDGTEG